MIDGTAMLTMVVSSRVMKNPMLTTTITIQGLTFWRRDCVDIGLLL